MHKSYALYKVIEEGVSHMWTVSALQLHPRWVGAVISDYLVRRHTSSSGLLTITPSGHSPPVLPTSDSACIVCDEDATAELRVKTVRYFKGIQETQVRRRGGGWLSDGSAGQCLSLQRCAARALSIAIGRMTHPILFVPPSRLPRCASAQETLLRRPMEGYAGTVLHTRSPSSRCARGQVAAAMAAQHTNEFRNAVGTGM
jgi:hypothetical protein